MPYDPDTDEYLSVLPPRRAGRVCAGKDCGAILNRYNTEDYCGACRIELIERARVRGEVPPPFKIRRSSAEGARKTSRTRTPKEQLNPTGFAFPREWRARKR